MVIGSVACPVTHFVESLLISGREVITVQLLSPCCNHDSIMFVKAAKNGRRHRIVRRDVNTKKKWKSCFTPPLRLRCVARSGVKRCDLTPPNGGWCLLNFDALVTRGKNTRTHQNTYWGWLSVLERPRRGEGENTCSTSHTAPSKSADDHRSAYDEGVMLSPNQNNAVIQLQFSNTSSCSGGIVLILFKIYFLFSPFLVSRFWNLLPSFKTHISEVHFQYILLYTQYDL